jgi:hypothetical protein
MTKLIKRMTAPLLSLVFLLNMSSAGMAETTVSAEVGFIFNTLLFFNLWFPCHVHGSRFLQCWNLVW